MTPDEKFIIRVYEVALEKGDPRRPINFMKVAKELGQKENSVRNAIKLLRKANMVEMDEDEITIRLTERGCALAESIRK